MGRKMKLPFLSKNTTTERARPTWPWPSCTQPRTLSFRTGHDIIKTINSAYLDTTTTTTTTTTTIDYVAAEPPESFFTNSSDCASFSTASEESPGDPIVEAVTQGLRSERLFFEPGETSSIMEETKALMEEFPFKESVVLSMESQDPYLDFKRSMEEMVEAHGLKDWEGLEELLYCYLKVNGKSNHGYIVGAFVDLLVGLAFTNSSSSSSSCSNCNNNSPSSPLSFYNTSTTSSSSPSSTPCISSTEAEEETESSTPCLSSLLEAHEEEINEEEDDDALS